MLRYLANCSLFIDMVSETAVFVTEVPILAPITIGIPRCTLITEMKLRFKIQLRASISEKLVDIFLCTRFGDGELIGNLTDRDVEAKKGTK